MEWPLLQSKVLMELLNMNNATLNREQFNEPINATPFYAIGERLIPFKRISYPVSKTVPYIGPKKVPYPVAKGLISHLAKRRKLV